MSTSYMSVRHLSIPLVRCGRPFQPISGTRRGPPCTWYQFTPKPVAAWPNQHVCKLWEETQRQHTNYTFLRIFLSSSSKVSNVAHQMWHQVKSYHYKSVVSLHIATYCIKTFVLWVCFPNVDLVQNHFCSFINEAGMCCYWEQTKGTFKIK